MAFDKIKAPTVRESFVRELENKIISGELKIGDKLPPAKDLCNLMGVSLTVVNAGMSELVRKGFVETIPRRGSYVADFKHRGNTDTFISIMRYNGGTLTENELRSFIETRMALDFFVVKMVAERATDEEIKSLFPLIEQMKAEQDTRALCTLVTQFYHKLTLISGNSFMALLYHSTSEPQSSVYNLYFEKNGTASTIATCEKLVQLCLARDADTAQKLVQIALNTALEGEMAIL